MAYWHIHVSNRYYDIATPLARSAKSLGLTAMLQEYWENDEDDDIIDATMDVLVVARDEESFGELKDDDRWKALEGDDGALWTDEKASILSSIY